MKMHSIRSYSCCSKSCHAQGSMSSSSGRPAFCWSACRSLLFFLFAAFGHFEEIRLVVCKASKHREKEAHQGRSPKTGQLLPIPKRLPWLSDPSRHSWHRTFSEVHCASGVKVCSRDGNSSDKLDKLSCITCFPSNLVASQ